MQIWCMNSYVVSRASGCVKSESAQCKCKMILSSQRPTNNIEDEHATLVDPYRFHTLM